MGMSKVVHHLGGEGEGGLAGRQHAEDAVTDNKVGCH